MTTNNTPAAAGSDPPVVSLLRSMEGQIAKALPKHLTADRMARIALTEIRQNPKLLRCDPYSVLGAIMQFAQLGLEVGGSLGHAYLVPYGAECTPITGYKGQVELMRRSGKITSVSAELVYPEDEFAAGVRGGKAFLDHIPARLGRPRNPSEEITAVWAKADFVDGTSQWVVLEKWEVDKIRDGLRYKSNVWQDHYGEMAKKTAIRRLSKLCPQSPELVQANAIEDGHTRTVQPFIDIKAIPESYEPKEQGIGVTEDGKRGEHKLAHEVERETEARELAMADLKDTIDAFAERGGKISDIIKGYDPAALPSWSIERIKAATDILRSKLKGWQ